VPIFNTKMSAEPRIKKFQLTYPEEE